MPIEVGEDSTPIKGKWNSSSISGTPHANTTMVGYDGESDSSFMKSFLDSSKLNSIEEDVSTILIDEDDVMMADLVKMNEDSYCSSGAFTEDVDIVMSSTGSTFEDESKDTATSLMDTDITMLVLSEDENDLTRNDSLLMEKSRVSRDSGISSLGNHEHLTTPVTTPPSKDYFNIQPDLKYKISIYSKVSGCRMTNLTDYWIVKQVRVAVLQRLTHGDPKKALSYKFGYEKMANGGLQIISDSQSLIQMLGSLSYFAGIPCKMTFPDTPRVVGFIKGLPTDLEPSDLKDEIRKTYPEVYSVRYVTEKSRGFAHGMQRPCAFISFNLRFLPKSVKIFEEIFELQVPNPMQCTRCCRYGHQGKQCRAQARCTFCGGTHQRQLCTAKVPSCINCLGVHTATSHDCLIWQQGKLMNELRYRGGMSAEEAIGIASSGKISQKKHIFTQSDFFENQDTFFFGSDNVLGEDEGETGNHAEQEAASGKISSVHPRACRIFPFLDLMTDFFLKAKNPGANYTSSVLMPGYDDLGFPVRKTQKNNAIAKHFKDTVKAMADESTS